MAMGEKRIETRSWSCHRSMKDQLLAIHASKRWTMEERDEAKSLVEDGVELGFDPFYKAPPDLGAIVAVVRLIDCLPTSSHALRDMVFAGDPDRTGKVFRPHERLLGNYEPGRFGWVTTDLVKLESPILYKGQQGIFSLDSVTSEALVRIHSEGVLQC